MAINFPTDPVLNQEYSYGGRSWKWNGEGWETITAAYGPTGPTGPTGPAGPTYSAGTGLFLDVTTFNNTGVISVTGPTDEITLSASTGNVNISLPNTAVTPASYGSASAVGVFTVDAKGRLTTASNTNISIAQSAVTNLTTDLAAKAPLASPSFTGTVSASAINISIADTTTAASHYIVEISSDGVLRPKTLANVQTEIVTNTTIQTNTVSPTATGSTGIRQTTVSTSLPTGGLDGDVWLVYE